VIRRGASVLLALFLCSACATNGRAAASPTTVAAPSKAPLIDVNDMMGAFPPATFYVLDNDGIKAIALLNHATRFTIPVGTDAQVAAAGPAGRLYVLDQIAEGARIRWFDLGSATERASRIITGASVVGTGIGHGALAIDDSTGIGYALIRDGGGIVTESFDWFTLKSAGSVFGTMTCPSRVLAGGGRVAVACMKEGLVVARDGNGTYKPGAPFAFVAVAMLGDGTLVVGAEDGRIGRFARNATSGFDYSDTVKNYGAKLIPDGIAVNAGCCFYFGVIDPTIPDVQVRSIAGGTMLVVFPDFAQPVGGIFVQAPFAYFVIGGRARHVDINQGFSEVMADLGPSAVPGAVANR
jgi:hypothetical protein